MTATLLAIAISAAAMGQDVTLTHQPSLTMTDQLEYPGRLAPAGGGGIYVTDQPTNRVLEYDATGALVMEYPILEGPVGIAVHPSNGNIFISRLDGVVGIYDTAFIQQPAPATLDPAPFTMMAPTGMAVHSTSGEVYVADSGGHQVLVFDGTTGLLNTAWGMEGQGLGERESPQAIAIDPAFDGEGGRILIADTGNFRVSVMDFSGLVQFKFGYRVAFIGMDSVAWFARSEGIAVDACSNIYVADALMGAVRAFGPDGQDLDFVNPPIQYGTNPGEVRVPCDVMMVGTTLYVASTSNASVEVYDVACTSAMNDPGFAGNDTPTARAPKARASKRRSRGNGGGLGHAFTPQPVEFPDNPFVIVEAMQSGTECVDYDLNLDGFVDVQDLEIAVEHFGGATVEDFLSSPGGMRTSSPYPYLDPPHMHVHDPAVDPDQYANICNRCHSMGELPGGMLVDWGQENLCLSCHTASGFAMGMPIGGAGHGNSHGWGMPADNGDVAGPAAGSPLALHLDADGDMRCGTCHNPHESTYGDPYLRVTPEGGLLCKECHRGEGAPTDHTPPAHVEYCTTCHDTHAIGDNLSLVAESVYSMPVVFTARTGANSFDDGDPTANDGICQVCHTQTTYHRQDGSGAPHHDGEDCITCHPHAAGFMPTGGSSCIACHSVAQGGRPAVVNPDGTGGHHLANGVLTDDDCVVCHEMSQHQGGAVRVWSDPTNPTTPLPLTGDPSELVPFCDACHSPLTHPTIHTVGGVWEPVCTQCHELHDPANVNLSLVNDLVHNQTLVQDMPVVFTARTGANSFADGDPANMDGICEVCHTQTLYHLYDGSGTSHNDGLDCAACHPHNSGFLPTGASCSDCHSIPQGGRRAVLGEFSLASHHLHAPSVNDADCVVCHEMSQHRQGQVRLLNVDTLAVVGLSGDPMSSPAQAALVEPLCLACHDNDGASGSAPFSDGLMPPVIDAALWAAASHSSDQMTCMGDGETFGCHSTGHGSQKVTLLAPWDGSGTGVPGDPTREEEGMCYSCHDADGPASTDVQALFALATHHNVSSLEQGDGSRVECNNCHDPHTASPSERLVDPDTGNVWGGNGPEFCLACHDGTPPTGVSFPSASPGTGYDKAAFVGTTHATGSQANPLGGNTCRHCHEDHGSQSLAMLRARYDVADFTTYSAEKYAVCWLCHDANETVIEDNAFKNRHKKHVVDEEAPCIICHDVHGGFDAGEPGLITFDWPAQNGYDVQFIDGYDGSTAFWIDGAEDKGYCYINCHDQEHKPKDYDRLNNPVVDCSVCHP